MTVSGIPPFTTSELDRCLLRISGEALMVSPLLGGELATASSSAMVSGISVKMSRAGSYATDDLRRAVLVPLADGGDCCGSIVADGSGRLWRESVTACEVDLT